MFCIECKKECPMHTEKYMDVQTPCFVCVHGENIPESECRKCIKGECHFVERDAE